MRNRITALLAALMCVLVLMPAPADAQRGGRDDDDDRRPRVGKGWGGWWWGKPGQAGLWDKLGEQSVGFGVDRDVIRVGRREGKFEAIKLRVHNNDIQLVSARVVYGNGRSEELRLSGNYRAGSETQVIRLDDDGTVIQEVQLVYRSNPRNRGEALVELWGLHADERYSRRGGAPERVPPPPPVSRGPAWEMLGEHKVDMRTERDVVNVGRWEGTFTKIRLKVLNHDIELRDVTIVYGNGETDQWVIRRRVRDEEEGPVFDLTGRRRVVERVILTYRATNPLSRTSVQVWGGR